MKIPFIPKWLKNKYTIATISFVIIIVFLDRNDIFSQFERRDRLKKLESSKQYLTDKINEETHLLKQLENNPAVIEKFAREKYLMKKDGEDIYIVPDYTLKNTDKN